MFKKMKIMKRNLFLVLPLLALVVLGQACSTKSDPVPAPTPPLGTFSGTGKLLVKKSGSSTYDTVKKASPLLITLATPSNFKVTGDTLTVHAGSKGLFQLAYASNGTFINFIDSTYKAGPQTKIHLAGVYQYVYDTASGSLIIQRANSVQDSVLRYDLKKTSN